MRTISKILLAIILLSSILAGQSHAIAQYGTEGSPMARSNNTFAFNLYQRVKEQGGNLIFSPYSISQALGMLYLGAGGTTQQQIAETLALPAPEDVDFVELSSVMNAPPQFDGITFQLNVANALWAQQGYALHPDYVNSLSEYYGVQLEEVDFSAPDQTAQIINQWVSDQTQDKINDLVDPSSLDPLTRLILVNAIYLNAGWAPMFDENGTRDDSFTRLDGSQVTVPMMHMYDQFSYVGTESYQVAVLGYQQPNFGMLVILPDQGQFEAVEAMLSNEFFESLRTQLFSSYNLKLALPRFKYDTNLDLAKTLSDMGMPAAFSGEADFSGIADEALSVNGVIHQAYISVDEKGTEAAAATEIGMGGGGPPNDPIIFNANRPFIYIIYEYRSGAILFIGRVVDPSQ
jgi:serpin B